MSKTAEEIGLIVGGLALAAVPGLQMLGLIAIQGHALLLSTMLGVGLSSALSGAGLALRQTPRSIGTASSVAFSDGSAPRRVIYGQFQTAGVLTYPSFPPSQGLSTVSQYLHLVYTLTAHEISSFDGVSVDGMFYNFGPLASTTVGDIQPTTGVPDDPWVIVPYASPTPSDFYWQHMFFEFDCGKPANTAQPFPNLADADPAWTSAFLQRGCAKVHVILRYDSGFPGLFPSGQIPNIQFLVTGKKVVDARIVTAWAASTSYAHFRYVVDNNQFIWFASAGGTSGSSRPNFEGSSGTPGATLTDNTVTWYNTGFTVPDVYVGSLAPPQLSGTSLVNDGWVPSTTYPGGDVDQLVIEAPTGYFQLLTTAGTTDTTYPSFSTTVGGTTSDNTAVWTCLGRSTHAINPSNSALCVADWLQNTEFGLSAPPLAINQAALIAAANVCEEQELIIWNADNSVVYENLYSCDGMFDYSTPRGQVLNSLCQSMAGWVVWPGDQYYISAGAYVTPSVSLKDDDMRGPIKGDFLLTRREVANGIKGTYVPAFLPTNPGGALSLTQVPGTWQRQGFPPYQGNGLAGKPDYINAQDDGQIIWQDLGLDFTTSLWRAQRLAKIALQRLRFQRTFTLPCKLSALALAAGDTVGFIHSRWGISGMILEIQQATITLETSPSGAPRLGVDLIARETDFSVYSFAAPSSASDYGEYSPYGVTGVMTGVE